MMGHRDEKGLYVLAAQHLFSTLRAQGLELQVHTIPCCHCGFGRHGVVTRLQVGLSFFEIYADELYDLLNARTKVQCCCYAQLGAYDTPNNPSVQLHAREDAKKRVIVQVCVHTLSAPPPCVT